MYTKLFEQSYGFAGKRHNFSNWSILPRHVFSQLILSHAFSHIPNPCVTSFLTLQGTP